MSLDLIMTSNLILDVYKCAVTSTRASRLQLHQYDDD